MSFERAVAPNVTERHTRACRLSAGGRSCTCTPSYLATVSVGGRGERRKHKRTFSSEIVARTWAFEIKRAVMLARSYGRDEHAAVSQVAHSDASTGPRAVVRMLRGVEQ